MTYDQLVTLDSIIKCGSFKAASELLHKSQPSLSVAIKKLEQQFQIQLFDRSGYRPVLTAEGRIFYEKAKLALMYMKSLELFGEELGMGAEAEVHVGVDGLAPLDIILCELRSFFKDYQSTNLTLHMEQLTGTIQKIKKGDIDLGFTPIHESHEDLESIEIYKTKLLPVYAPSLLEGRKLDFNLLKILPQVVVTDSGVKTNQNYGVLEDARRWVVTTMESKKQILKSGLGWGRLPTFLIEEELKKKELLKIELKEIEAHTVQIYMVRNKKKAMGPISKKLWDLFDN